MPERHPLSRITGRRVSLDCHSRAETRESRINPRRGRPSRLIAECGQMKARLSSRPSSITVEGPPLAEIQNKEAGNAANTPFYRSPTPVIVGLDLTIHFRCLKFSNILTNGVNIDTIFKRGKHSGNNQTDEG